MDSRNCQTFSVPRQSRGFSRDNNQTIHLETFGRSPLETFQSLLTALLSPPIPAGDTHQGDGQKDLCPEAQAGHRGRCGGGATYLGQTASLIAGAEGLRKTGIIPG